MKMANELENVKLITPSADENKSASTLGAGGSGSSNIFVPMSAAATETTGIFRGEHAREAELKIAAKFRAEHPDLAAGIPDTQLDKIAAAF